MPFLPNSNPILRPSTCTSDHWGSLTPRIRYLVFFIILPFNLFANLVPALVLTLRAFNAYSRLKTYYSPYTADPPFLNTCDSPCVPAGLELGPAAAILFFGLVDALFFTRVTLHSTYTLIYSLILFIALVNIIPWLNFSWEDEIMLDNAGLFAWTVTAQALLTIAVFAYFVMSCVGVHKHRMRTRTTMLQQAEARIPTAVADEMRPGGVPAIQNEARARVAGAESRV